jgi:DNA repair protein RecN (Recombination protein N)
VFDEIDVGVSGRVSQAIAEKLYQLSLHHQVLCVTHQPIVAAMADQHLRVSKHLIDSTNSSHNGSHNGYSSNGHSNSNGSKSKGRRKKLDLDLPLPDPQPSATEYSGRNPQPAPAASSLDPSDDVRTVVRVASLSNEQRKQELAQLAGGESPEVLAFAESLLNQAASLRQAHLATSSPFTLNPPAAVPKVSRSKSTKKF